MITIYRIVENHVDMDNCDERNGHIRGPEDPFPSKMRLMTAHPNQGSKIPNIDGRSLVSANG